MKFFFLLIFICASFFSVKAQEVLPNVSVKESGGKVIISWLNDYKVNVTVISIQRSYDSLRNFTTIGAVLNPQNLENGYLDANPPYDKMYYRVFISFEGGTYVYSKSQRPVEEIVTKIVTGSDGQDSTVVITEPEIKPWQVDTAVIEPVIVLDPKVKPQSKLVHSYGQDVVLEFPFAASKRYEVKFFDENKKLILNVKDFKETYLIIEKVNFKRSGTYTFELYENGSLIEENFIIIVKDGKNNFKR